MKAIGVIPARYQSSRFPGKILTPLLGKPLIQHVYEAALKAQSLEDLIIAADDQRVVEAAQKFGARVVMTAREHQSGSDRLTEIVNPMDTQIIVNIQADEPLIHHSMIDRLVDCLFENKDIAAASLIYRMKNKEDLENPNVVKVVKDRNNFALYFSRSLIPHPRGGLVFTPQSNFYKHLGLYAYTKEFLFTFTNLPTGDLENIEKLEQLRILEHGHKIKLIETNFDTIGVDTPEDLEKVKVRMLSEKK